MAVDERLQAARILVVDDDAAIQRMIMLTLASEAFEVEVAGDGMAGLRALARNHFDLVVLDLQMPRMDGRTMYREMRSQGYTLPVLVLSAYQARAALLELGAEAALEKPFDIDLFIGAVRSLLTAHPVAPRGG